MVHHLIVSDNFPSKKRRLYQTAHPLIMSRSNDLSPRSEHISNVMLINVLVSLRKVPGASNNSRHISHL